MVDLDGTLARTAVANLQAYSQALAQFGVVVAAETLEQRIGGRHWKQFLPAILDEAGCDIDPALIAKRKAEIYKENLPSIAINTALLRAILSSRPQLKTALVTSASRTSVDALLAVHSLAGLFDLVVTGDDVTRHKPDPEAYRLAARTLGVAAEETLIYEDSDIGVASAEAFGAHVLRIVF